MSLLPASADLKARVARLEPCDCKLHNWTDPHLTIELDHIPLQRGEATAISYVWGEFDRRDVPVGHPPEKSEDVIRMNLGIEWVTQDVIHRLAEIAADKPIWMDQLCIPQNDEEIRKILASIATIYKTFDVAVLLPGHPCACLPLIVKELEARESQEGKDRTPNGDDDTQPAISNFCLNVCPLSSWTSRLWTFQEFGFSQSVRCVWVSKDVAKCIFPHSIKTGLSEPEYVRLAKSIAETNLQPYPAIKFQRLVSAYLGHGMEEYSAVKSAWWNLCWFSSEYLRQIRHEFVRTFDKPGTTGHWIASIRAYGHLKVYRFLSGEVIQRDESFSVKSHPDFRLLTRILLLRENADMPRKATHARDYVIAIFTELHGYCPPPNYKNEKLAVLLQHALDWYRLEKNNIVILSTAPQGLFMPGAAESFLWRPTYYLSFDRIKSTNDVYRTLTHSLVRLTQVGTCEVVLLRYYFAGCIPLSAVAKSWESFYGDFAGSDSVLDVVVQLRNTIQGWEIFRMLHIATTLNGVHKNWLFGEKVPNNTLQLLRLCILLLRRGNISKADVSKSVSVAQLHLAFYELVCRALYLDAAFCREKGVKLMFSPPTEYRQHTRVGLCRGDVKLGGEQAHDSDHIMANQCLTVGFEGLKFDDVQFEAERIDDHEGKPAYRVFGVWVRMEDKFENDIGAVHDPEKPSMDALLL